MSSEENNERNANKIARRKILIQFTLFSIGIFFNNSGYGTMLSLQSSINIEGGIG